MRYSKLDALFCGQFIWLLNDLETPNFPTAHILDRVFIFFFCSHYTNDRFLGHLLLTG